MKRRNCWVIVLAGLSLGTVLLIAFSAAQPEAEKTVTLEDIYTILFTEEGENRLELIQQEVENIHREIHGDFSEHLEKQGRLLEEQRRILDDIMFLLDVMSDMLDDMKAKVDTL